MAPAAALSFYSGPTDLSQKIAAAYREVPCLDSTPTFVADTVRNLHRSSPSEHAVSPDKYRVRRQMQTSARVIPVEIPNRSSGLNTDRSLADQVRDALLADHGHLRARKKHIARLAGGISPRTVEGWEQGKSVPHLEHFLELGKHSPSIRKMVMRLWNLDPDIDPEYQRAFMDLMRAAQNGGRR